jgi:WD40 repeat protein
LISGSGDLIIRIWDAKSGKEVHIMQKGHAVLLHVEARAIPDYGFKLMLVASTLLLAILPITAAAAMALAIGVRS